VADPDLSADKEQSDLISVSTRPLIPNLQTARMNNPQIKQSTKNTHCDKPSNLIPHDKDHTGDPMSFVPIFHSESTRINNLPTTQ
jgi:hypothetical protein